VSSGKQHSGDKEAAHDASVHDHVSGNRQRGVPSRGCSHKENKMRNRLGIGLIALVLLLAMSVLAQNNTGIISGRIMDQTGALVPNAQITVTQTETGVDSISQSNSEGLYRVPGLRDGPYKVTVTAAGFKKTVREGFDLQIGQILDVEIKLEVGNVTESVTVTNSIPLLDTQTSSTGQVMEGDYFYELPNYQHWEKGVLYYTPQVESSNAPWPARWEIGISTAPTATRPLNTKMACWLPAWTVAIPSTRSRSAMRKSKS